MAFITLQNKNILIDKSDPSERLVIEMSESIPMRSGYDGYTTTGFVSNPDFGYYSLAKEFWIAALSIYFIGIRRHWEDIGYAEPWLFNSCHSIELYLKGFLQCVLFFEEINRTPRLTEHEYVNKLFGKVQVNSVAKTHELIDLYNKYRDKTRIVIKEWNKEELSDPPETKKMFLSKETEEILKQIDEASIKGFRFRYPSFLAHGEKNKTVHRLHELDWKFDENQHFPITGLPKKAGQWFNNIKVMNTFHALIKELRSIAGYHEHLWWNIDYFIQGML